MFQNYKFRVLICVGTACLLYSCQAVLAMYAGIKPKEMHNFTKEETREHFNKFVKPTKWNIKPCLVELDTNFIHAEKLATYDSGSILVKTLGLFGIFIFDTTKQLNSSVTSCQFAGKVSFPRLTLDFENSGIPLLLDNVLAADTFMHNYRRYAAYMRNENMSDSIFDPIDFNTFKKYFIYHDNFSGNYFHEHKPIVMLTILTFMNRQTKDCVAYFKKLLDDPQSKYYDKFSLVILNYDNVFSYYDIEFVF